MNVRRQAPTSAPGPLSEAGPRERLARWDELAPAELTSLEHDPHTAAQLRLLRDVDGLLRASLPAEAPCPPAEDLYDYAGGPGATPLDVARRRAVVEHLELCAVCAEHVQALTLAAPPPAILEVGGLASGGRESTALRIVRWLPMAAAAALLGLALLVFKDPGAQAVDWPSPALLRGDALDGPLFPRGPVLASGAGAALVFEAAAVEHASLYRVVLARHAGDAFARGDEVLRRESATPTIALDEPLSAGSYTWEAWAVVDGLDRHLGARDFRVLADEHLANTFDDLDGVELVRALHDAGYRTDARRAARALPASAERDAFLGAVPGR